MTKRKSATEGTRTLLVQAEKQFKITIPAYATVTFGPWAPPKKDGGLSASGYHETRGGTLRIYGRTKTQIIACFAHVTSFRDLSLDYSEKVAVEEGATVWKNDERGYEREVKSKGSEKWVAIDKV